MRISVHSGKGYDQEEGAPDDQVRRRYYNSNGEGASGCPSGSGEAAKQRRKGIPNKKDETGEEHNTSEVT